mgnify:CR=1 FL=1
MTEPREPRVTGDLSVLDAWRLLATPVPTHRAAGYVGLCAVILLLNLSAIAAIVAKVGIPMIVNGMENRAAVRAVAGFRNTLKTQTSRQVLEVDTGFGPSGGYLGTVQKLTFAGGTAAIRSSVYGAK